MKNVKRNIVVFILIAVFIATGMFSIDYIKLFVGIPVRIATGQNTVSDEIDFLNGEIGNRLAYRGALMDVYSIALRASGTVCVKKDDDVIAVSKTGFLCTEVNEVVDEDINDICQRTLELQKVTHRNNAEFLYVYAPEKEYDSVLPAGVKNYSAYNHDNLMRSFESAGINTLDLAALKESEKLSTEEMYFITDHHWKPESGFWANVKVCERLHSQFGFVYNQSVTDITNYHIETHNNIFLGSSGKKVGRYFSPLGIDDIDIITPTFPTSLTMSIPAKEEERSGTFEEALLDYSQVDKKDLYGLNPYEVYGYNVREKIIYNDKAVNDTTIVIACDSYAICVNPFLALNTKELHIVDMRDYKWFVGDKINLNSYIQEVNPDYVIVFYKGVRHGDGSYDFF